jgi:hypothetical protein
VSFLLLLTVIALAIVMSSNKAMQQSIANTRAERDQYMVLYYARCLADSGAIEQALFAVERLQHIGAEKKLVIAALTSTWLDIGYADGSTSLTISRHADIGNELLLESLQNALALTNRSHQFMSMKRLYKAIDTLIPQKFDYEKAYAALAKFTTMNSVEAGLHAYSSLTKASPEVWERLDFPTKLFASYGANDTTAVLKLADAPLSRGDSRTLRNHDLQIIFRALSSTHGDSGDLSKTLRKEAPEIHN